MTQQQKSSDPEPEYGSYRDNLAAFQEALMLLERGRWRDFRAICDDLRDHILRRSDEKSVRWLLPRIDEARCTWDVSKCVTVEGGSV